MAARLVSTEPATGAEIWSGKPGDPAAEVAAARAAWPDWAAHSIAFRIEALRRFANEVRAREKAFADLIARETGKPLWEARTEVGAVVNKVERSQLPPMELPPMPPPKRTDPTDDPVGHGEYLATLMHCVACHTPMTDKGPDFSKAFAGCGGFTVGPRALLHYMRYYINAYGFSCALPPAVVAGLRKALEVATRDNSLRETLWANTRYFREKIASIGLEVLPGEHPIVPVMFGEAQPAVKMAEALLAKGVYVIPFSFPVVPKGKARIRTQVSAAHSKEDLDFAVEKFAEAKSELGIGVSASA